MEAVRNDQFWPSMDDPVYRSFFEAVETGNLGRMKQMLLDHPDIKLDALDGEDGNGYTAITKAAAYGHMNIIDFLLDNGVGINAYDSSQWHEVGLTALQTATRCDQLDIVRALLDKGADPQPNKIRESLLELAVTPRRKGHPSPVQLVTLLLERGIGFDPEDEGGRKTAAWAATAGDTRIMKLLIDDGRFELDDTIGAAGRSYRNRIGMVKFLLGNGAPITPSAPGRNSTLARVITKDDNREILDLLLANASKSTITESPDILRVAARNGHVDLVKLFLDDYGFDVNADLDATGQIYSRQTPLSAACMSPNPSAEVFKLLLSYGADPNAQNAAGETPLHVIAIHFNGLEARKLLIDAGADLRIRNNLGQTPLISHAACFTKRMHLDPFKLVLSNTDLVDAQDVKGRTALHSLASLLRRIYNEHIHAAVRELLGRRADVSILDQDGLSAHDIATRLCKDDDPVLQLLSP